MPLISLSKVSFDYGRVSLLRDVDFAIERGERAAIVGRNGVGKTTLFNILTGEMRPDLGSLDRPRRLRIAYLRQAQDTIARYSDEARINALRFDRHDEEVMVETFTAGLRTAGLAFVRDPMGRPLIPNWSRVIAALPEFLSDLRYAVQMDLPG